MSRFLAVAAAPAGWRPDPPFPLGRQLPPSWYEHQPLPPGHVVGPAYRPPARIPAHAAVTGGMPGWQLTVIAAAAVLLATVLAVIVYRLRAARRRVGANPA